MGQRKRKRIKLDFIQIALVIMFLYGVRIVEGYFAQAASTHSAPDATVPIAAITAIIGVIAAYVVYKAKLKASLNNNGLYINDTGEIRKIGEKYEEESVG